MIGPIFLRGDLIHQFKEHLTNTEYHRVIHNGVADTNSTTERFKLEKLNDTFHTFINSDYPIICKSGSKSTIPFWDYHIAVNRSKYDKEVIVTELLVREPNDQNVTNAVLMAFYMLINEKYKYERLVVPIRMNDIVGYEEIGIQSHKDGSVLFRKYV
ncbi:hypothetical protein MH215_28030 [Paenibacillus sp. ACRSA]|uniref:hypothetical protein n=1 Tax=Paenibacillus sp. ACRSA TaxID=2918211 RepID=UPI001EF4A112|nr:hypothetical protein [Paenibacillus sp. ACRSA]MCG7380837.1 hypothetical protein [Paenibacillus sp. ACRSA]